MKLQLNERTLNAYINRALNEELDELFGSRVRKQSQRMITGKGWGNQRRDTTNGWGAAANSTIDANADAESDTPQTLVGMIGKLDQALKTAEQYAGVQSPSENLMASVTSAGGVKKSLLAAINALTQIGNRLNKIERMSGSNAIMESAGDYMDATVGGNAAAGNARNIADLTKKQTDFIKAEKAANQANGAYGAATRNFNKKLTQSALDKGIDAEKASLNARKAADTAKETMKASKIGKDTGFWGKQVANVNNGAKDMKAGWQTMKGAKNAANVANATTKAGKATRTVGNVAKGVGQVAKGAGQASQLAMMVFSIADEAARQAAQGRQRNIVRTYNCAATLAKRLGNIMKEIEGAQQSGNDTAQENINEINVSRGMKSFDSIESGMEELSGLMQQLGGGGRQKTVQIPQGIDLNTREGVLAFQQWANSIPVTDANGNALREDGIFGTNTSFVYDKIAQMLQRRGQTNRGLVRESKAVETALANLERVAGTTGSGGNAYASIGAMSGGENASRLQNAQNIKNIIRTYPPVLNQYLNTLADAGADVSALQPLNVDTRPHRNYSVKELQAIDTRIQQLLQIARGIEVPEGQNGGNVIIGGTLPPKPVRNPNPPVRGGVRTPQMPELGDVDVEDQDIQVDDVNLPTIDEPTIDKMGYRNRRTGEHGSYEYVDDAISQMMGFARGNTVGVREKMSDINKIYSQAKHTIDTAVQNGDWTAQQARERRQKLNDYYKEVKRIAKS